MHYIPLSCTSSPCNLLFLNLGTYSLVQATVGVGNVLIRDFCVARTRGGGGHAIWRLRNSIISVDASTCCVAVYCSLLLVRWCCCVGGVHCVVVLVSCTVLGCPASRHGSGICCMSARSAGGLYTITTADSRAFRATFEEAVHIHQEEYAAVRAPAPLPGPAPPLCVCPGPAPSVGSPGRCAASPLWWGRASRGPVRIALLVEGGGVVCRSLWGSAGRGTARGGGFRRSYDNPPSGRQSVAKGTGLWSPRAP